LIDTTDESDVESQEPDKRGKFLQDAFASEQECLSSKLRSSRRITHAADRGEVNEQYFIEFLRAYLPNRYTIEKAIVIDSNGYVSDSIDIVVFDRQYTPTLLDSDKHRYVPVEAVYAVFECKAVIDKEKLEYAGNKAESVRCLMRTSAPFTTTEGRRQSPHFKIIAGLLAIDCTWADKLGKSFKACHATLKDNFSLDCVYSVDGCGFDIFDGDDKPHCYGGPNALANFAFRLLSKLQNLGTAPAADWRCYAETLMRDLGDEEK
jgi:hypothetical protein